MKIIYVNCGWRREYESDLRSNEHYSSSSENKARKKIQACTGFESMTSAIPVQCSTNWLTSQLEAGHYVGSVKTCEAIKRALLSVD